MMLKDQKTAIIESNRIHGTSQWTLDSVTGAGEVFRCGSSGC